MRHAAVRGAFVAAILGAAGAATARAAPPDPAPAAEPPDAADGGALAPAPVPFGPDSVWAVVRGHEREITACYEERLLAGKDVHGVVLLSFVIGKEGLPGDIRVKKSTLGDARVEACLLRTARTWLFPKPSVPQPVELPLRFDEVGRPAKTP
jgi:TonB family protein